MEKLVFLVTFFLDTFLVNFLFGGDEQKSLSLEKFSSDTSSSDDRVLLRTKSSSWIFFEDVCSSTGLLAA